MPLAANRPHAPATLILTDASAAAALFELPPGGPEMRDWTTALADLATDPRIDGELVLDPATLGVDVSTALAAWRRNHDPTQTNRRANALAESLQRAIQRRGDLLEGGPRYIVIAGDDRVIPLYRLRIDPPTVGRSEWATETVYFSEGRGSVAAGSTVGAALSADMTLTDDLYGDVYSVPMRGALPQRSPSRQTSPWGAWWSARRR